MKILYCAIDQAVPGTHGGSVHVTAVAEGLAGLGHEVHALVTPGGGPWPAERVDWIAMRPPLGARQLRWARMGRVRAIAERIRPDVILERYYNFGGEGIAVAASVGAIGVLEVNAPVIDHPGSTKARLDKLLLFEPMRRWRDRTCRLSTLIVTPSATILPPSTPPSRIVEVEWGADTERFRPGVSGGLPFTRPPGTLAVFAGAFRSWHGAIHLVHAIGDLRERGRRDINAVFIGDGPELARVRAAAAGLDGVTFTGAIAHQRMPACLAAADVGVAPFDLAQHAPLALGFYWSPLKIFEYMASGLPVVAPRVGRIPALVEHDREGWLYDPLEPRALAAALERMADADTRQRLGNAARERAVREYSWQAHCEKLDAAMRRARAKPQP